LAQDIHWIDRTGPGRLGIMARPRAGDWLCDEIEGWRRDGVDLVVSLLEADEVAELALGEEAALCARENIAFRSFPIPDRGLPESHIQAAALVGDIVALAREGKAIAIHCRAGIGRSALIAAAAMVASGSTPDEAFEAIGDARGIPVPDTDAQRRWVEDFHESLGRDPHGRAPPTLALGPEEIARRLPVWHALANLFLDNEPQPHDYRYIASAMKASGFSAGELHSILADEVGPAFIFNLMDIAGEWSGWTEETILSIMAARGRLPPHDQPFLDKVVTAEWAKLAPLLDG
jgi:protein-tyrosine phosphatase